MNFSSVVSLHTNRTLCGVANFSAQLAQRFGVRFVALDSTNAWGEFPLFSLKASEMIDECLDHPPFWPPKRYGVFWHDRGIGSITQDAECVFYADQSLGTPGLFCPSLITPKKRTVKLFTFGMAHKIQPNQWRKVQQLLRASEQPYHLRVSVGLHEGTSLDGAEKHFDALKDILGEQHVTILGILSDDAVSEELANADYTLAFFEKGARANNTTIHAALAAGSGVITNWDADTPLFFNQATKSIDHLTTWPMRPGVHYSPYTWDELLKSMERICAQSRSASV